MDSQREGGDGVLSIYLEMGQCVPFRNGILSHRSHYRELKKGDGWKAAQATK